MKLGARCNAAFFVALSVGLALLDSTDLRAQADLKHGTIQMIESSTAERKAEATVSLSVTKIISLLRQEAGLLLDVKRALVQKAFEQGRILDSADLTDESLFRLIEQDENIRLIATHEIEDGDYLKTKKTRQKSEHAHSAESQKSAARMEGADQDEEDSDFRYRSGGPSPGSGLQSVPAYPQLLAPPQGSFAGNPLELRRTEMQTPEYLETEPADGLPLRRIRSNELPELFEKRSSRVAPDGYSTTMGITIPSASLPAYGAPSSPGSLTT